MIAAVALAAAAICDWTRPPAEQLSVVAYQKLVIGSYRSLVRPLTSRVIRCPFSPTCSGYSELAMQRFGLPKGAWLTARRLLRCMPWVPAGTKDPVPTRS